MSLASEQIASLAWAHLWQVTVLVVAIGVTVRVFCRNRPHLAYVLWVLTIIKCVTPPLWTSATGVFSWANIVAVASPSEAFIPPREFISPLEEVPLTATSRATHQAASLPAHPQVLSAGAPVPTRRQEFATHWWIIAWGLGAASIAILFTLKRVTFERRLSRSLVAVDPNLETAAAELCRRLAVRRQVRLRVTSEPIGPAVYGVLRPTLLLPRVLVDNRPLEQLRPILAHELIHVRRGDAAIGWLQIATLGLWWFHPLIWWVNRQISRERERCCDEEVIASLDLDAGFYGQCLIDVLKCKERLQAAFAVPGVRRLEITQRRLEHIMNRRFHFHRRMPRIHWITLAFGLLVVLPGAGLPHPTSAADVASEAVERLTFERPTVELLAVERGEIPAGFRDEFSGAYDNAWTILRHNPETVSLTKTPGMLTITTERGGFWKHYDNFHNLFLIDTPMQSGNFVMTTRIVGFDPQVNCQQAGLVCFNDPDNYVKFGLEFDRRNGGKTLAVVPESNGIAHENAILRVDDAIEDLWLRIVRYDAKYIFSASRDGVKYTTVVTHKCDVDFPATVGILAKNGNGHGRPEIDARFDLFEIVPLETRPELEEWIKSETKF